MTDEQGVKVLEVGKANQLGTGGLIANVALFARIHAAPLGRSLAKEGHVEHIGFRRVHEVGLRLAQLWRDEVGLDGVGVDAVVDLGEIAADIPAEGLALGFLESLELLDQVQLELDRDPRGEFQGDV